MFYKIMVGWIRSQGLAVEDYSGKWHGVHCYRYIHVVPVHLAFLEADYDVVSKPTNIRLVMCITYCSDFP